MKINRLALVLNGLAMLAFWSEQQVARAQTTRLLNLDRKERVIKPE